MKSNLDETMQSDTRQNPEGERRLLERRSGHTIAPVLLKAADVELSATVRDISVEGMALVTDRPLEAGTDVTLNSTNVPALRFGAQVKHIRALTPDKWLLGCALSRRLLTDDILSLG